MYSQLKWQLLADKERLKSSHRKKLTDILVNYEM